MKPSNLRDTVGATMLGDKGEGLENEDGLEGGGNLPHCKVNTDGQVSMYKELGRTHRSSPKQRVDKTCGGCWYVTTHTPTDRHTHTRAHTDAADFCCKRVG